MSIRNANFESKRQDVRLLAVDLDGTLLDSQRQLLADGAAAIRRAIDQGVIVALASGRILTSMKPFADQLGLKGPFVCSNGAHVVTESSEELAFHSLDTAIRETIIRFALDREMHLNAYTRNDLLFLHETPWSQVYRSRVRSVPSRLASAEELLTLPISKMMLVGEPHDIPDTRRSIEGLFGRQPVQITESEPEYLEFLSPNANKGAGIALLAKHLGIAQHQTAAIGDYLNDLEMLQWAGLSAAVGNAPQTLRDVADVVVMSNEEGGVAFFIDSYVLNRQE